MAAANASIYQPRPPRICRTSTPPSSRLRTCSDTRLHLLRSFVTLPLTLQNLHYSRNADRTIAPAPPSLQLRIHREFIFSASVKLVPAMAAASNLCSRLHLHRIALHRSLPQPPPSRERVAPPRRKTAAATITFSAVKGGTNPKEGEKSDLEELTRGSLSMDTEMVKTGQLW